ncbi:transmembrane channel 7 isoform X1 [Octopus vulgaris]|uniref:Transmembrane channel 7 isoform X1 n=1 Tax=Octopus vulgaris TaxID=6645 RepID=A0AA36B3K0_OCTVU|nr:transmembrane channel 7 isoform X1 [Octopus vulgaris]
MEDDEEETFSIGLSDIVINTPGDETEKIPSLTELELNEAYLYCTRPEVVASDPEMNIIYAKTLPVRKRRTSYNPNAKARSYSTAGKIEDVTLESLLTPTDTNETKTFKQSTIRFLPKNMTFKKKLWQYIEEEKKLSKFQSWKKERKQKWNHFKADVRNSMKSWGLWSNSIKAIKGEYGNAMVSFFHFLRWLVILNFLLMLIMLCVTTFPFVSSYKHLDFSYYVEHSGEKWIKNNKYVEDAEYCSKNYSDFTEEELKKRKAHEHIKDALQGTGFMENTVLFYGSYHNITVSGNNYNMSLAYILATLAFFFVSFIAIIVSIAKGIKESLINELSTGVPFSQKVFASWDFCMKNDKIVRWKKTCLLHELRADLATQRELWVKSSRTFRTKVKLYSTRLLLNVIVLCILFGSLALIYYSSDFLISLQKDSFANTFIELLVQFLPSLIISVLNVLVPIIFNVIIRYEGYTSSFEVKLKLLRIVLLRLASVAVLLFSLYDKLIRNPGQSICNFKNQEEIKCWETYVGQQFYKLIILDFAIVVFVNMVIHTLRRLVYNYFHKGEDQLDSSMEGREDQLDSNMEDREVAEDVDSNACKRGLSRVIKFVGPQEFELPQNVLDIVYLQSLCWLGTFFSPLSPAIITVQLFIIFYVKRFTLTFNCVQALRPFRSSKSNSLFMFAVLLSFTFCILPISFVIGSIEPSKSCGPFRVYSEIDFSMFTTLSNLINSLPDIIAKILNLVFTPAIMVPLIVIICFFIYYNFIVVKGCIRMEDLLREQLVLDGKDKRFLLNKLKKYKTISKL